MKVNFAEKFFDDMDRLFSKRLRFLAPRMFHDFWYRLKCRLWKKYNTVRIKTLPYTWTDRCDVLPHAMFQILEDFVVRESHQIDWNSDEENKKARQTMDDLIKWWKEEYLKFDPHETVPEASSKREKIFEESGDGLWTLALATDEEKARYQEITRLEQEMEEQLIEKMKQLCELRMWLWS